MLGWGSASFVVSFILPFHRLIMRASSGSSCPVGLRIEGRPAEESDSGRTGGGFDSPAIVVSEVLPICYLPPLGKGKGKISEIRYPYGSEYLRAFMRYADIVGPSRVEPSYPKILATRYGPPLVSESSVLIFSRLMWCPFPRWSISLRQPLRTASASLCTPSSKAFYNISMCARPSPFLIFGASWSTFWLFSGIRASGSLVYPCCWISSA